MGEGGEKLRVSTQKSGKENDLIQMLLETGLLQEKERWIWEMIQPERLMRLYQVLNQRTRYISVLLEAVDDGHNQAAVLRTADAFGIQNISVVTGNKPFEPSKKITQGSHKWLTIRKKPDLQTAIKDLKSEGYQIYATYLGDDAVPIGEIDLSKPTVLIFGNEHKGISKEAANLADGKFYIPMYGFVQSFNISVAAALALQEVTKRAREIAGDRYGLTDEEKRELLLEWIMKTLRPQVRKKVQKKLEMSRQTPANQKSSVHRLTG
ncbi:RNA methyltransferase [Polycladomyces sp. WAk]|uniref:tRNA (guanosine(18)-2'-O)-methyltransferase n=2 Tax=Polycladomyces zharkentensis TaxID=2807616 RepID=A0ABS2WJ14_9BACL|nr:RNA methyltransferase [Polycladomyces sp. WAk]